MSNISIEKRGAGPPTVDDVLDHRFVVVPDDRVVKDAIKNVDPSSLVVIVDEDSYPVRVGRKDTLLQLPSQERPFKEQLVGLSLPAVVSPGTQLARVLELRRYDRSITWFVVVTDERRVIGFLSREEVSAAALLSTTFRRGVSGSSLIYAASLVTTLFGLPKAAPPRGLCYLCHITGHRVRPVDVDEKTPSGEAICPNHKAAMTAELPCRESG